MLSAGFFVCFDGVLWFLLVGVVVFFNCRTEIS